MSSLGMQDEGQVESSLPQRGASTAKEDASTVAGNDRLYPAALNAASQTTLDAGDASNMKTTKESQVSSLPSPVKPVKRLNDTSSTSKPQKRGKTGANAKTAGGVAGQVGKGQSSLMGFFKPKNLPSNSQTVDADSDIANLTDKDGPSESEIRNFTGKNGPSELTNLTDKDASAMTETRSIPETHSTEIHSPVTLSKPFDPADQASVIDPIVSKESWSKLLGKRVIPRCEHQEPCISLITKKPGANCGRSFYMCSRPLGPSGQKEKNSQWRCGTFIWSSDWTGEGN